MNGDYTGYLIVIIAVILAVHLIWHDRGHRS
jgi:hypothetical protein